MAPLTSRQGADRLGVNIQKFHRLVAANDVEPVVVGTGLRGAKFWNPADIDALALTLDGTAA
jgi:hypothetical protein